MTPITVPYPLFLELKSGKLKEDKEDLEGNIYYYNYKKLFNPARQINGMKFKNTNEPNININKIIREIQYA